MKHDTPPDPPATPAAVDNTTDPLGTERGYVGEVPDPNPNSAYSLESGPPSPPTTS